MDNVVPFFSIVIPSYNRGNLIADTLKSVFEQSYDHFEVIVVDDGSTDNTESIVSDFIIKNKAHNFFYFKKQNEERGAARNFGVLNSKGTYITYLDSDDLLYVDHLKTASDFIMKNNQPEIFHQAYEFKNSITGSVKKIAYPNSSLLNQALLKGNIMSCFGVFIRSDVAKQIVFDVDRRLSGSEDWLLWLKFSARYNILFNNVVTGCMIEHSERSVLSFNKDQLLNRTNLLLEKLSTDEKFVHKYGFSKIRKIHGHMHTYIALHLILSGDKVSAVNFFLKGVILSPSELFKIRTLALLKHLFLI